MPSSSITSTRRPSATGRSGFHPSLASWIFDGFQITGPLSRFNGLPFTIGSNSSVNAGGQAQSASQINPVVAILGGHAPQYPLF